MATSTVVQLVSDKYTELYESQALLVRGPFQANHASEMQRKRSIDDVDTPGTPGPGPGPGTTTRTGRVVKPKQWEDGQQVSPTTAVIHANHSPRRHLVGLFRKPFR
jgi:hypothetical protein